MGQYGKRLSCLNLNTAMYDHLCPGIDQELCIVCNCNRSVNFIPRYGAIPLIDQFRLPGIFDKIIQRLPVYRNSSLREQGYIFRKIVIGLSIV